MHIRASPARGAASESVASHLLDRAHSGSL